jgi:hypothetical protein
MQKQADKMFMTRGHIGISFKIDVAARKFGAISLAIEFKYSVLLSS